MKLDILDINRLIEVNKLEEVKSPRLFASKTTFDPDGILSNEIFGVSKSDRRGTFAYGKLNRNFLHPHIYSQVMRKNSMFRGITSLIAGQKRYSIKNGLLIEDPDGWTGIYNLYEHWEEIDWTQSQAKNKIGKSLLSKLPKDLIFIDKYLIIPPAYRDVMLSGTMDSSDHVNELNDIYQRIIRMNGLLAEGGLFARTQYATQLKVQETLVEMYEYFKRMISKKQGLIRKNLLGKSIDYGVRAVISAPKYNNEHFEDNMVDLTHTAVPIGMCLSIFYPFIESWLINFFQREIINSMNYITLSNVETGAIFTAPLKDPEIQFSDKAVRKMMNDYALNPDNRFKPLQIECEIPGANREKITKKANLILKGKEILPGEKTIDLQRLMTITDLLYIACYEVCKNRHVMVSRYPVGTDKNIIFTHINVRSTNETIHAIINGNDFPYYPKIDLKLPARRVGVQFIDTITYSNSHCEGMGEPSSAPM